MNDKKAINSLNDHDAGGVPLTAEEFSDLLYRQITTHDAFDAIEGASRKTATEFVVCPFDGPRLLVKVVPALE